MKKLPLIILSTFALSGTLLMISFEHDINSTFSTHKTLTGTEHVLPESLNTLPETQEFLQMHIGTNRVLYLEEGPLSISLHASGGYTGEYLKVNHLFGVPVAMSYVCWTDNANAKDTVFDVDVMHHLKSRSCGSS